MARDDVVIGVGLDANKVYSELSRIDKAISQVGGRGIGRSIGRASTIPMGARTMAGPLGKASGAFEHPLHQIDGALMRLPDVLDPSKWLPGDWTRQGVMPQEAQRVTPADYLTTPDYLKDMKTGKEKEMESVAQQRHMVMPFLSLMFAAMAAQKAIQGLVEPAMKAAGIQEIINSLLEIFFLPIMLLLLDPLFFLFDALVGLDEETQLLVGGFAMIAFAIALVTMFLMQFGLAVFGVMGFVKALGAGGALAGGVKTVSVIFSSGGLKALAGLVPPLAIVLIILTLILLAWDRFKKLVKDVATVIWDFLSGTWDNLVKLVGGVIKVILGVIAAVVGMFLVLVGIVTGNEELIAEGWKVFVTGLGTIFEGIIDIVTAVFDQIILSITKSTEMIGTIVGGILEVVSIALSKVISWILETFMPDLKQPWEDFSTWLGGIWDGIKTTIENVLNPILGLIDEVLEGAKSLGVNLSAPIKGAEAPPIAHTGNVWDTVSGWFSEWDTGGPVPSTGPGLLHAGEYVVPRGGALVMSGGGGDNIVNVYANVSNDVDINMLADQISRIWHNDFNRRSV